MVQTIEGAAKSAAKHYGLTLEEYNKKITTHKACKKCKLWKSRELFGKDRGSKDGLSKACVKCRRVKIKKCWKGRTSTFKGKKHTEEAKRKIGLASKGRVTHPPGWKHTEETKKKISAILRVTAAKGEKCHSWKGGIYPEHKKARKSVEYKDWRTAVFTRDHYTCQKCGDNKGGNLNAHHILGFAEYPQYRYDDWNGITLCETCHTELHSMAEKTGISWCHHTQNFWKGCRMVSPGCKNCYMFREMNRYGLNPEEITRTKTWSNPRRWNKEAEAEKKPKLIFTCSWSDFFIEEADPWRDEAWGIIKNTPWLQWQILTKRIKRVNDHLPEDWGDGYPNVWIGTSIESAAYNWRADALREVKARVRFISAEPLIAPLTGLNLKSIHWLIAGGESGPEHRPMEADWVRELRDMCNEAETAFYYKQESSLLPAKNPPLLDGRTWEEYPEIWTPEAA